MKRALISVFDKSNLEVLLKKISDYELIATGTSAQYIKDLGYDVTQVSDITKFEEILGGRVKTLHPNVFAGILSRRTEDDDEVLKQKDIKSIDLVVCNLYPFYEVCTNTNSTEQQIIENIDIGGVSLIRAAAKNFNHVSVLVDHNDYSNFDVKNNKLYATKAFQTTAKYDEMIFNYFSEQPLTSQIYENKYELSYGENHQQKAQYLFDELPFEKLNGKQLSYNNLLDLQISYSLVNELDSPTCCAVKHNSPCGVGFSSDAHGAYLECFTCDEVSIFGGIVSFNCEVDEKCALKLSETFLEIVSAPSFTKEALDILKQKKNLRVLLMDKKIVNKVETRNILGGKLVQDVDNNDIFSENFDVVSGEINETQKTWLQKIQLVCKYVKSNSIVIANQNQIVAINGGQTSRISALNQAASKITGSEEYYLASDAFFPFDDAIKLCAKYNIKYIIQPGGSIKDDIVISSAKELKINMALTKVRHFKH